MGTTLLNFDIFELPPQSEAISRWEGQNAGEILIFYTPTEDNNVLLFLDRVLRAAQIELSRDTHHQAFSAEAVPSYVLSNRSIRFQTMLAFGFTPRDFGLQFNWNYYVPIVFQGKTFLFCDPLPLLLEERARGGSERSGPFWKALQQIFLNK